MEVGYLRPSPHPPISILVPKQHVIQVAAELHHHQSIPASGIYIGVVGRSGPDTGPCLGPECDGDPGS